MTLLLKNRKVLLIAGLAIAVMTVTTSGNIAHAEETKTILDIQATTISSVIKKEERKEETKPVEPTDEVYVVKAGDTLESISKAHTTPWKRLWDKNATLHNPDVIVPGQRLTIPRGDEVVPDRPLPIPIVQRAQPREHNSQAKPAVKKSAPVARSGAVSGNRFVWGWCTWFASQQRPDLPVSGNARNWIRWSNSTTPNVGAVAVNTSAAGGLGHVAIVIGLDGNRVKVRHMNYKGFGVVSEDWTNKSYWSGYIY